MSRDGAFSRAQQTKNWCVGFSFPPPAHAGIHPTLYLFGFRANALNSHSPLLCLALIAGRSGSPPAGASGAFGRLCGLRDPPSYPAGGLCTLQGLRGPRVRGLRGPPKGVRGSGGGLRGLRGLPGPVGAFLSKGERSPRRGSCPSTWRLQAMV